MRPLLLCLFFTAQAAQAAQAARADPPPVRVAAVGDLLFGRYKNIAGRPVYLPVTRAAQPLQAVAPLLRAADIAFGNLECPAMPEPPHLTQSRIYRSLTFRADPPRLRGLRDAGLTVLSLANNHTTNLGLAGAPLSRGSVQAAGLAAAGAGATPAEARRPALLTVRGQRVALLAYTTWTNRHSASGPGGALAYVRSRDLPGALVPAIQQARRDGADHVVVSLHWGVEYAPHPADSQRRIARALIDAGAALVLGHHPHVLQDFERYHGGLIAYSLGNFLFDNGIRSRRETALLQAALGTIQGRSVVGEATLTPVLIDGRDHLPRPATGAAYHALARRLRALTTSADITIAPPPNKAPRALALSANEAAPGR